MIKDTKVYKSLAAAKRTFCEPKPTPPPPPPTTADITRAQLKNLLKCKEPRTVADLKPDYCCGCRACFNCCPTKAISMTYDDAEFLLPVIDNEKCINCGKCKNVCPVMNTKYENDPDPVCLAVKADDETRKESSSGGMFSLAARQIFAEGGVVCGAAYNEDFSVGHIIIDSEEDLYKLRGSKYIMSDTGKVFSQIKTLLDSGYKVLFTGTPCQAAGLKGFLGKDYDNLLVIDLVCHGGPSKKVFHRYLDEYYGRENLADFKFRTKEFGYSSSNLTAIMKDGRRISAHRNFDPFEKTMHSGLALKSVCKNCMFAPAPRQGDITMGDFWGLMKYNPDMCDDLGTSVVLINNEKGRVFFEKIKSSMLACDEVPFTVARQNNRFGRKQPTPGDAKWLYKMMEGQPFAKAVEYASNRRFDVGVIGLWYGRNYGSMSTYFALHQVLTNDLHLSVLMIENPLARDADLKGSDSAPRRVAAQFYDTSARYRVDELHKLNSHCDTFIVGSDQLWNVGLSRRYRQMYFLDFVNGDNKRISYGTSFGKEYRGTEEEKYVSRVNLQKFDHISVRDSLSKRICEKTFGVKATEVCDPTLLCNRDEYNKLIERARVNVEGEYILAYILDPFPELGERLEKLAEERNCKIIVILDEVPAKWNENAAKLFPPDPVPEPEKSADETGEAAEGESVEEVERPIYRQSERITVTKDVDLYDWMWYYSHAKAVVTDSFHGTIFSIVFRKPFVTKKNVHRGGARFVSLLTPIGLMDRLFNSFDDGLQNPALLDSLDYTEPEKALERIRQDSLKWLKNALYSDKKTPSQRIYGGGGAPKKLDEKFTKPKLKEAPILVDMGDNKTVDRLIKSKCTGCGVCSAVCPKSAIKMTANKSGFAYPDIDYDKCVNCGICSGKCPVINLTKDNLKTPDCHAVIAEDEIRMKSSSGGVFTLLAERVLENGGAVVGAAMSDDYIVEHTVIESKDELEKLRGSKYVQSNAVKVYPQVKKLLEENRPVLFSGCPCQVAGVKSYLGKDYDNLLTMDIVCHGVPSPKAFEMYIKETCNTDEIAKFKFRTKSAGYNCFNIEIIKKDGTSELRNIEFDNYEKCFHNSIMLRESCYNCKFCTLPRHGDITAGDFWGVSRFDSSLNDGKGTSVVLANNTKGKAVFDSVLKEKAQRTADVPIRFAIKSNRFGEKVGCDVKRRNHFFSMLENGQSFTRSADYAVNDRFDVAIMGVWPGCNYGSIATYYALNRLVTGFGLSVLMIDKPLISENDPEQEMTHSMRFALEHYAISDKYRLNELYKLNAHADTFMMGCDQVWNRGISRNFGMAYYFDFVEDSKKKLAYASSFGHGQDFSSVSERATISGYMKRFDAISVREADGVTICKDVYGAKATQVLDPVFVADREIFDELCDKSVANSRPDKDEKYIATYILDPTPEKKDALKWVSEKLGLKLINLLDGLPWTVPENTQKMQGMGEIPKDVQVEDWLYYIKNCEFLVTDSCHGMSFGIIFNRPFIGIGNKRRGVSRFQSLTELFGLTDRYVGDPLEIIGNESLLKPIDYEKVNAILAKEKALSKEWLKNALFAPKTVKSLRAYPVYDEIPEEKKNGKV